MCNRIGETIEELRSVTKRESRGSIPPAPDASGLLEQMMRQIRDLLAEEDFKTEGEAEAFMRGLMAGQRMALSADVPSALDDGTRSVARKRPKRVPNEARDAISEAQDLIYQAWDARTARESIRLARKALKMSPDCADAYVILGDLTTRTSKAAKQLYEQGVAAAERMLGPDAFIDNVGHFWGLLETRPYMRARFGLARAEYHMGNHSAAIAHAEELLRLNPDDNQGIRYALLTWLLAEPDRRDDVAKLLLRYDDASADWAYGRALHLFKMAGGSKRATAALRDAVENNRYVAEYLLGTREMPMEIPTSYGLGDDSEAVLYAAVAMPLWDGVHGAIEWLRKTTGVLAE
jgi:tetratricopeptide (TPR) repeat protein